MNFHNPWATSTFGTNGVSPVPDTDPVGLPHLQAAVELHGSRPGSNLGASFGRNFKAGMTQAWNFSVEQQLSNTMAVRVAYVGSESYHQSYVQDDNFAGYSYCTSTLANCPSGGHGSARSLRIPPSATFWNTTAAARPTTTPCRLPSSGTCRTASRRSPALPGRRRWTWPVPPTSPASQNGSPIPGTCAGAAGISVLAFPSPGSATLSTAAPELKGQSLLVREVLGGWETQPASFPGNRALRSASAAATATGRNRHYGSEQNGSDRLPAGLRRRPC